jgi:beta-exotoxin I transport system permease protein
MLGNVFLKGLRDQRRALVGWGIGIVLLVLLEAALWPSIRDMPDLKEFLASYPEAMRELFNLEDFGTGTGFMNAELFSAMLPILFIIFAIGRGARMIAGEEESGTLDVLLLTPVSAVRLVLHQGAALAAGVAALGAVLYTTMLGSSWTFGLGIGAADLAGATLAMVLLGVEFGWLALAVGAALGRRAVAIAVASAAAVAAYVLYVAGELVGVLEPWQPLSPFHQALDGGPLGAGLPAAYAWMPLAAAAVLAAALPVFDRRDIAAAH